MGKVSREAFRSIPKGNEILKVLQLGKFYYPTFGGIEQVMYEIAEGLNASGIKSDVLCANTKAKYEEMVFDNYKVYKTSSYGLVKSTSITPQLVYKLWKIHKNYDIIHIHHPNPMAFLALFIVRPKCKVIVHWHSDIIRQKKVLKYFLPLQHWVLDFADKIIATSQNYAKHSPALNKFEKKVVSIPIGISDKKFLVNILDVEKIENKYLNKKIILAIGRFVSYKGFKYLVESAKYLNNDFIILIGGEGPQKKEIKEYILSNKLEDKVELLGYLEEQEKYNYLKACDIFCLPSITKAEAFGVVLLEAMIFSKPLVTSNIKESGMTWVNKNNISGLHVDLKSPKSLANAFMKLQKDEIFYKDLSQNSYKRYKTFFTQDEMIKSLKDLYRSIL